MSDRPPLLSDAGLTALWRPWGTHYDIGIMVSLIDIRSVYGHADYLVEPIAGVGRAWVREGSLTIIKEENSAQPGGSALPPVQG